MDPKIQEQLDEQEVKINQIYDSVKKTERYMRLTFWVTIGVIVLPILLSLLILPPLISSLSGSLNDLTGVYQF